MMSNPRNEIQTGRFHTERYMATTYTIDQIRVLREIKPKPPS